MVIFLSPAVWEANGKRRVSFESTHVWKPEDIFGALVLAFYLVEAGSLVVPAMLPTLDGLAHGDSGGTPPSIFTSHSLWWYTGITDLCVTMEFLAWVLGIDPMLSDMHIKHFPLSQTKSYRP